MSVAPSVQVGSVVSYPQAVTGAWEQQIAGKIVGFNIEIRTATQGLPTTIAGAVQRVDYIWITTYVRRDQRSQRTFWSSQLPAQFSWEQNHLVLREPASAANDSQPVALDLRFDPAHSEWRGRLGNAWYDGKVALTRPFVPHVGFTIIGDWIWGDPRGDFTCKHISLGADSALVVWSDIISLFGNVVYPKGTVAPRTASEWYGDLDMDSEVKYVGTDMMFFTGTKMSGALVVGAVNARGDAFTGEYAHFGNGVTNGKTFNPFSWRRTTWNCST